MERMSDTIARWCRFIGHMQAGRTLETINDLRVEDGEFWTEDLSDYVAED